jgi:hypothetical protein
MAGREKAIEALRDLPVALRGKPEAQAGERGPRLGEPPRCFLEALRHCHLEFSSTPSCVTSCDT